MSKQPRYARALASWEYGIWMVRLFGWFFRVKSSWNRPLFSERHAPRGFWLRLGFGWRLNIVRVGEHA